MSSREEINIGEVRVMLVKSARAKHVFLKQNTKGDIVLTCPKFCPKIFAVRFAKSQLPWILAHIKHGPKETVFVPGDCVSILGKEYHLQTGKRLQIVDNILFISGDLDFFHRRVCSIAQKQLLPYIQQRVHDLTAKLGVKAGRITLRNTSSRWGSCSSTRNLSFCWKIAFAPIDVIDYLVAHEVSHLVQMNHSARFWGVVDSLTDKRKSAERWLKTNGRTLQAIR